MNEYNNGFDLIPSQTSEPTMVVASDTAAHPYANRAFCSIVPATTLDKHLLYRAATGDGEPLDSVLNTVIKVRHIVLQPIEYLSSFTGELSQGIRTILVTVDGKILFTVSSVVADCAEKLMAAFGKPEWIEGIDVRPVNRKSLKGRGFLFLELASVPTSETQTTKKGK